MNITENWLNELDSMTETDRRITLGSPEWKELIDFARQGLRLQEVEKWKAEQQQALITMAATLLSAGFKGDHVVHGVKWLACELEAAKRDTKRLEKEVVEKEERFIACAYHLETPHQCHITEPGHYIFLLKVLTDGGHISMFQKVEPPVLKDWESPAYPCKEWWGFRKDKKPWPIIPFKNYADYVEQTDHAINAESKEKPWSDESKVKEIVRTQLLSGERGLRDPFWRQMNSDDRLLHACLCAYAKHVIGKDIVGWDRLGDILHNAICEAIGDDAFCTWGDRLTEEESNPTKERSKEQ